ncbi:MAG: helix-turn-helix transcriptional regulator [Clostridia bacterium]|nr:helix-turn-helix transcriptional regulator [Clostridia bacterium]
MEIQLYYPGVNIPRIIEFESIKTFFNCEYQPGYHFKGERHNFWEFVLILGGAAGICAGETMFTLKKGQCFWHRPGEFHSIWTEGDQPLHLGILSFTGKVALPLAGRIFSAPQAVCDRFVELRKTAEEIFTFTVPHNGTTLSPFCVQPGKEVQLLGFMGEICSLLSQSIATELPNEHKNTPAAEKYLRILSVISQNQYERLTVQQIAEKSEMTVSNAKRIFNKYAGCSISDYYNNAKLTEAKHLLSLGMTVAETANRLGFEDPNYFCSFFKRLSGMTPSGYRATCNVK